MEFLGGFGDGFGGEGGGGCGCGSGRFAGEELGVRFLDFGFVDEVFFYFDYCSLSVAILWALGDLQTFSSPCSIWQVVRADFEASALLFWL